MWFHGDTWVKQWPSSGRVFPSSLSWFWPQLLCAVSWAWSTRGRYKAFSFLQKKNIKKGSKSSQFVLQKSDVSSSIINTGVSVLQSTVRAIYISDCYHGSLTLGKISRRPTTKHTVNALMPRYILATVSCNGIYHKTWKPNPHQSESVRLTVTGDWLMTGMCVSDDGFTLRLTAPCGTNTMYKYVHTITCLCHI